MRKQFFAQNHSLPRIDIPVRLAGIGSGDVLPNGSYTVMLGTYQTTVIVSLSTSFTLPGSRFTPGQIVSGSIVTPSGVTVATIPATELMPVQQTTIMRYKLTAFNPSITPSKVIIALRPNRPRVSLSFDVDHWEVVGHSLAVKLENADGRLFIPGIMNTDRIIYVGANFWPATTVTAIVSLLLYSITGQVVEKMFDVTIEGNGEVPVEPLM